MRPRETGVNDAIHQFIPFLSICDARDQGGGVDQRIRHDDRVWRWRRLTEGADPVYVQGVALICEEDSLRDAHEMTRVAPDSVEAGAFLRAVMSPQRLRVFDRTRGEAGKPRSPMCAALSGTPQASCSHSSVCASSLRTWA